MGQVWSSADFDGTRFGGFEGGRGSVLAVVQQHAGPDGIDGTTDDITAPLNRIPVDASIDWVGGSGCVDDQDRVRNFIGAHTGGAFFVLGDGSVRFVNESIDADLYRGLGTFHGGEVTGEF